MSSPWCSGLRKKSEKVWPGIVVVAVHLYNTMERRAQVEWNNVIRFWLCGTVGSISQCYEVKQCIYGYYQAVLHFCKKEYNDGIPWSRIPEGAQNSIPKSLILGATTTGSTHHRSSWTGQMNFSYSLISNSFNSIIIVLYLIWNIQVPVLCYTYCGWYLKNSHITQVLKSS